MDVTIQLLPDIARAVRGIGPDTPGAAELKRLLDDLGADLQALHPDPTDKELLKFFLVKVPEGGNEHDAVDALSRCAGVSAAYVKPPDEPARQPR